jgi:hypothetical protein
VYVANVEALVFSDELNAFILLIELLTLAEYVFKLLTEIFKLAVVVSKFVNLFAADAVNEFNEPNAAVEDVNVFNCEIELLTLAEVVSKFVSLPAAEDVNVFNEVISVVLPPNDDVDTNVETLLPLPTQVYPFANDAVNEPLTFIEPEIV